MKFPTNPFWDFSTKVYGKPKVAKACLVLQEKHGIDVNILLFCCWHAHEGFHSLSSGDMKHITDEVTDWHHQIVRGLRAVRQKLKNGYPPAPPEQVEHLRKRIIDVEIECERAEQHIILQNAPGQTGTKVEPDIRSAAGNLKIYLTFLEIVPDRNDVAHLVELLTNSFPDHDPKNIAEVFTQ